ncbi:MAG: sugar ABC transporter permease [Anaerolineae bacterium]|jgi:multiple sugar transport system permease protein|nr:sugar ABC transporter permease [Anaerolineae bacterium]
MKKLELREPTIAVLFLIPAIVGLLLFYYYPIGHTLALSAYDLSHTAELSPERFVGLQNYVEVLQSKQFWSSIRFTLFFTLVAVSLELTLGMMLALSTYWVWGRLTGILRAIIIIPWAIPQIIQASIWRWMYNTDVGLIGDLFVRVGLTDAPPLFLSNPSLARWAVIVAYVWKGASVAAIFLMGGLALVPKELTDAAKVDGARSWRRFWTITVPMIMPTILVTLLFRTMAGLQIFDIIYGLTNGGPGTTTETLSSFSYKYYFKFVQYGRGSAYAVVTFLLVLIASVIYIRRVQPHFRFKGLGS